jgi:hypothetical protein
MMIVASGTDEGGSMNSDNDNTDERPTASDIRFRVEPRDVPPHKAARRLHLTEARFLEELVELLARGFPAPDATTGYFDLKKIDEWMDRRHELPANDNIPADARAVARKRLDRLAA